LDGTAAARLLLAGRRSTKKEEFEHREDEDAARKQMKRRKDESQVVFGQAREPFLAGFKKALEERGVTFDPVTSRDRPKRRQSG
jgi:hypothetical protein